MVFKNKKPQRCKYKKSNDNKNLTELSQMSCQTLANKQTGERKKNSSSGSNNSSTRVMPSNMHKSPKLNWPSTPYFFFIYIFHSCTMYSINVYCCCLLSCLSCVCVCVPYHFVAFMPHCHTVQYGTLFYFIFFFMLVLIYLIFFLYLSCSANQ